MNTATLDTKQIANFLDSDAFKDSQAQADQRRVKAHASAVDELLVHESDTAEVEQAQAAAETARRVLAPLDEAAHAARRVLAQAVSEARRIAWLHESRADRLRAEVAKHLPDILRQAEHGIFLAENEIRASFSESSREVRMMIGSRTEYWSNSAEVAAAREQVSKMRELISEFSILPMAEAEILRLLAAEARSLIELARSCGAKVSHCLPQELLDGAFAESPDRKKTPYVFPRVA